MTDATTAARRFAPTASSTTPAIDRMRAKIIAGLDVSRPVGSGPVPGPAHQRVEVPFDELVERRRAAGDQRRPEDGVEEQGEVPSGVAPM